ncbi:DUF1549 domain-containing protein [Planctomicrobium sp. SH668]|uniref:DUF1549 domain-containing protein n=1 Tax=Planctomicrobium sp. SH668 TaxID=3448126 RepID=UPI003F5BE464
MSRFAIKFHCTIAGLRPVRTASILVILALSSIAAASDLPPEKFRHFENVIRPLLAEHCFQCHGPDAQKGGLRLDSRGHMLLGGDSGASIVPDHAEESLIVEAIRFESFEMPPSGKLTQDKIDVIVAWINDGAYWPGDDGKVAVRKNREQFSEDDRKWWAIQPLAAPQIPTDADESWCRNEIDSFISQKQQQNNLTPAPEADRRTLIRRVYQDLIGLPPSADEIRTFVADEAPDAYERLIDHLLARPEYGERWGRHWLDLVRYSDSDGYRADGFRPQAWRYRDYVVSSFNSDKPYDQFIQEQIAGDEMFPGNPDALTATGYLRQGIYEYNARDVRGQWTGILNEITDVTSDVFLGLGLQCARCHDHKFDPLLQTDYYRLRAFFEPILPQDSLPAATAAECEEYAKKLQEYEEKTVDLRSQLEALEKVYKDAGEELAVGRFPDDIQEMIRKAPEARTPEETQLVALAWRQVYFEHDGIDGKMKGEQKEKILELRRQLAQFAADKPAPLPLPMTVTDVGPESAPTIVPKKGTIVPPGFPTILANFPAEIESLPIPNSTGRRTTLAKWMTQRDNPLTARVIVNRVWQYHFGRGLAENSSDFGRLGAPPSHPELLDWLTISFLDGGWRFKSLHKQILTSATYRQAANHPDRDSHHVTDPLNLFLWHAPTRRLDAEQIRDSILAVTGQLRWNQGGPGALPDQPVRSIYTRYMRNSRDPLLDAFDLPQFFSSASSRDTTTSPIQSLLLINSQVMIRHADVLAKRVLSETEEVNPEIHHLIDRLWWTVFGRSPTDREVQAARQFIETQTSEAANESQIAIETQTGKMPYRDGQAIVLHSEQRITPLSITTDSRMNLDDLTIESYFQLRSIYDSGKVRTIAAKWKNGDQGGWAFGVTGKGSRRKPQTLVLQMFGRNSSGKIHEAAIFSDQHIDINKPYFAAVSIKMGTATAPGTATFYLKDLSNDDEPLNIAEVQHDIIGGLENNQPFTLGMRFPDEQFDGLIDDVRLSKGTLSLHRLLLTSEESFDDTIGYWKFDPSPGIYQDSSASGLNIDSDAKSRRVQDARVSAFRDLCHILLNSNEFLYVD